MGCSGITVHCTRSTRWVVTSTMPSPCCSTSKYHSGRVRGWPETYLKKWWTLSLVMAGSSGVPFSISPKSDGMPTSTRCSSLFTSERSVMMSYTRTPFAAASSRVLSRSAKFLLSMAMGLSERTFIPASTAALTYPVFLPLLPASTTTLPRRSEIIFSRKSSPV